MIMKTAKTAAGEAVPEKPSDEAVADAMRELDSAILALMHLSNIAADTFDRMFYLCNRERARKDENVNVVMTEQEFSRIGFLVNHVAERCTALHRSYNAAYDGEVLR